MTIDSTNRGIKCDGLRCQDIAHSSLYDDADAEWGAKEAALLREIEALKAQAADGYRQARDAFAEIEQLRASCDELRAAHADAMREIEAERVAANDEMAVHAEDFRCDCGFCEARAALQDAPGDESTYERVAQTAEEAAGRDRNQSDAKSAGYLSQKDAGAATGPSHSLPPPPPYRAPRYDEVFAAGTAWLNGEPPPPALEPDPECVCANPALHLRLSRASGHDRIDPAKCVPPDYTTEPPAPEPDPLRLAELVREECFYEWGRCHKMPIPDSETDVDLAEIVARWKAEGNGGGR
jgi:hypothetical protein